MVNKKTVIQVWTHKVKNLKSDDYNNFWGLGDIIRGTIKLFQLSKKLNFTLLVDIQLHPVSTYLKQQIHPYNNLIQDNKDNINFMYPNTVENHILNSKDDVIYFLTNDGFQTIEEPLTEECKNFLKSILVPNEEFMSYLINKLGEIPYDNFEILHYRLGDETLIRNNNSQNLNDLKNHVEQHRGTNSILMSDNIVFKNHIKNSNSDIFMFDIIPVHLGYHDNYLIRDTLFEFFVMVNSKKIKTYSVHGWISGFVYWTHLIYDIPYYSI